MKVTVIGGGSTYTPELVSGFLERVNTFPLQELCLMDIQPGRLEIVGGFIRRMVEARGASFIVTLTNDLRQSILGANYIITQLRVGMMQARREDEYLGCRHGLIGQETIGVGGMAKALRTIPVIMDIAREMHELAPEALLVNFTNPSGLITEALFRYAPEISCVGLCNAPITMKKEIIERLDNMMGRRISEERAELDTLGLNHLSWYRGFRVNGEDLWPQIIQNYVAGLRKSADPEWDPEIIETLQMIPNYYLQYYYYTSKRIAAQQKWPPSRAEEVMEIEKDLLADYANPALFAPPPCLMLRGGAYYSTLATQLLDDQHNDRGHTHIVNVRQGGAVSDWPADWVLELPCRVDRSGIHPLPTESLPSACSNLLTQMKMYELLTIEAAVHGDRKAAYQALLANPLGPSANQLQAVLDDLLETHREYLPQFWK